MRNWLEMLDQRSSTFESVYEFLNSTEIVPGVSDIRPGLPESV